MKKSNRPIKKDYTIIKELLGQTFDSVRQEKNALVFESYNVKFTFYHDKSYCGHIVIEDIVGDLKSLQDSPLTMAEVSRKYSQSYEEDWTFYRFASIKGYVTVRWYGISYGNYSTSVNIKVEIK